MIDTGFEKTNKLELWSSKGLQSTEGVKQISMLCARVNDKTLGSAGSYGGQAKDT